VLSQGGDIVPIPGTKHRSYLEENIAAGAIEISTSEMSEIAEALPKGAAAGGRYPEAMMAYINR
jgi:aryl-alcohol dehydrogenase-like predicted oxidoreductase